MKPNLRVAVFNDRADVEAVVRAAYVHYVPRIGREPGPMLDDYAPLIEKGQVYVLEHENQIRGVLVLIPEAQGMLLDNVAVDPCAQGQGLGRVMLEFAEAAASAAGLSAIRLYTHEAMTENIALYLRRGYEETHRGETRGLRRIYMTKQLACGPYVSP